MFGAERTFLNLRADAWQAVGIWLTIVAYLAIAVFAWWQLREARALRVQQYRPYVIANIQGKSILIFLVFENIGATQAKNVKVTFDQRLEGSKSDRLAWQDSTAFTKGIPMFAPGFRLRFFFDSFPARRDAGLPMTISGRITYEDTTGNEYDEPFVIDLTVYGEALQAEKDLGDLVTEVKELRQAVNKWTDGNRGLLVNTVDRDKNTVRSERPYHLMKAKKRWSDQGWRSGVQYMVDLWRRRHGWYSR